MLSCTKYYYDRKNINNTIIVAGVGRSGTTLLAQAINYDNEFRFMFEPFNKYKVKTLREMNYRLYIPHLNNDRKVKEKYYKILSGNLRNSWVDQYNKKLFCNKRIIKEIRINQSLKWIKLNFPEIPIIYIVRHPCAVTLSKLRLDWDDHLFEYISQIELVNDYLKPYINVINSAKTAYERHLIGLLKKKLGTKFLGNYVQISFFSSENKLICLVKCKKYSPQEGENLVFLNNQCLF